MAASSAVKTTRRLVSVDFEVFGRVQGVFFRKCTKKKSEEHGLVGWVKNTHSSTVVGQLQGANKKIKLMKEWLSTTGSPKSNITKCEFTNERTITKLEFTDFKVVRKVEQRS